MLRYLILFLLILVASVRGEENLIPSFEDIKFKAPLRAGVLNEILFKVRARVDTEKQNWKQWDWYGRQCGMLFQLRNETVDLKRPLDAVRLQNCGLPKSLGDGWYSVTFNTSKFAKPGSYYLKDFSITNTLGVTFQLQVQIYQDPDTEERQVGYASGKQDGSFLPFDIVKVGIANSGLADMVPPEVEHWDFPSQVNAGEIVKLRFRVSIEGAPLASAINPQRCWQFVRLDENLGVLGKSRFETCGKIYAEASSGWFYTLVSIPSKMPEGKYVMGNAHIEDTAGNEYYNGLVRKMPSVHEYYEDYAVWKNLTLGGGGSGILVGPKVVSFSLRNDISVQKTFPLVERFSANASSWLAGTENELKIHVQERDISLKPRSAVYFEFARIVEDPDYWKSFEASFRQTQSLVSLENGAYTLSVKVPRGIAKGVYYLKQISLEDQNGGVQTFSLYLPRPSDGYYIAKGYDRVPAFSVQIK